MIRYIGEYQVLGPISSGGMGEVHLARHERYGKTVALKLIRAELAAVPHFRERFLAEGGIGARLQHPNIVEVYETREHDGRLFLAMQYIEGVTLQDWLADPPADRRAGIALMAKVARAVHHAHQRSVVHRDLKPSNILVDEQGEPYVTDFGIAKLLDSNAGTTQTGAWVGSLHWMSPEQALDSSSVNTAADVWSLGAILFEVIAGRPLWEGNEDGLRKRIIEEAPRRLRDLPGLKVDRDLSTITEHCLCRDPDDRYASAQELALDLEAWLRGEPIAARPVSPQERLWKWARRNPALAGLAVVLLATALAWGGTAIQRARSDAAQNRRLSFEAAQDQFNEERDLGAFRELSRILDRSPLDETAESRTLSAIAYRHVGVPVSPLFRHPASVFCTAMDPAGRRLAVGTGDGRIVMWNADDATRPLWTVTNAAPVERLVFSGKERLTALLRDSDAVAWDIGRPAPSEAWRFRPGQDSSWVESEASSMTGFSLEKSGRIWRIDLVNGSAGGPQLLGPEGGSLVCQSVDGHWLARVGGRRFEVTIGTAGSDVGRRKAGSLLEMPDSAAFTADAGWVFFGDKNGVVTAIPVKAGLAAAPMEMGAAVKVLRPGIAPTTMLAGLEDGRVVELESPGKPARTLVTHRGHVTALAVSRRTGLIASGAADGSIRILEPSRGGWRATAIDQGTEIYSLEFDPTGTRVIAGTLGGLAMVWDGVTRGVPDGAIVHSEPSAARQVIVGVSVDGLVGSGYPDGRYVVSDPARPEDSKLQGTIGTNDIQTLAFTGDGGRLLLVNYDGWIRVEDRKRGTRPVDFKTDPLLWSGAWTLDESAVVAIGDGSMRLVRAEDGRPLPNRGVEDLLGARNRAQDVASGGTAVATGTDSGDAYLWRVLRTGALEGVTIPVGAHFAVALSPDGHRLAVGRRSGQILIYDVGLAGAPALRTTVDLGRYPRSLRFLPDGGMLAAGVDGHVYRLDAAGTLGGAGIFWRVARLGKPLRRLEISPDARSFLVFTDSVPAEMQVFDVELGEALSELIEVPARIYEARFTANSRWLVAGLGDGTTRVWRVRWPESARAQARRLATALGEGDLGEWARLREGIRGALDLADPAGNGGENWRN